MQIPPELIFVVAFVAAIVAIVLILLSRIDRRG